MDPDVTLAALRQAAESSLDPWAYMFEALDSWIVSGGFMPQDWQVETKVPQ